MNNPSENCRMHLTSRVEHKLVKKLFRKIFLIFMQKNCLISILKYIEVNQIYIQL